MLEKMKTLPIKYIGAGLCGFSVILAIILCAAHQFSVFHSIVYILALAVLVVPAFVKLNFPLRAAGLGILALYSVYNVFHSLFILFRYSRFTNLFTVVIPQIILLAGFALALILVVNKFRPFAQLPADKLWLAPAGLVAVYAVVNFLFGFLSISYFGFGRMFASLLFNAGVAAALFFVVYEELNLSEYVAPEKPAQASAEAGSGSFSGTTGTANTAYSATSGAASSQGGYYDILKHVLLLFFTFGIYLYIWIYRTTIYTNRVTDEEPRNPVNKLLLSIFIPFYYIYWLYVTAQRVDKIARAKGSNSDIATISLILAIFINVVAPIFVQLKINELEAPSPVYAAPQQPAYQPPVYTAPQQPVYSAPVASAPVQAPAQAPVQTAPEQDFTQPAPSQPNASVTANEVADGILRYKELLDAGIITQEEFDAKKKQLLGL